MVHKPGLSTQRDAVRGRFVLTKTVDKSDDYDVCTDFCTRTVGTKEIKLRELMMRNLIAYVPL